MIYLLTFLSFVVIALFMRHAYVVAPKGGGACPSDRRMQRDVREILDPQSGESLTDQDLEWLDQQARQVGVTEFEWVHWLRQARGHKHHPITDITREAWLRDARKRRGK